MPAFSPGCAKAWKPFKGLSCSRPKACTGKFSS